MPLHTPKSSLFPYTTLFRSRRAPEGSGACSYPSCSTEDLVMRTTYDFAPLWRSTIGFDRFLDLESDRIRWKIDRKSTRLNSSHANISYAVFCLKKKNYQHKS